jgi:hypothetical protein
MRKKYNTLNEEMNRMKSLFGESRLYGNIVDIEEEIITEQFKFFDDLASAFKLALKNVNTKNLNRFINYVVNDIGDVVKYLDDVNFKPILKTLVPTQNWDEVAKTVKNIQRNFNKIPEASDEAYKKFFKDVIAGIPEEGGMRNNIIQMMNNKRYGSTSNLPAVSGTKEVVRTTSGEVAIGTKNTNGVIVYKNEAGKIIPAEQIKKIPDAEEVKYFDVDGNEIDPDTARQGKTTLFDAEGNQIDVDGKKIGVDEEGTIVYDVDGEEVGVVDENGNIIDSNGNVVDGNGKIITKASDRIEDATIITEVSPGTTMDELNGKVVEGTDSNIKNIEESQLDEASETGAAVIGEQKLEVETDLSPEQEAMLKTLDNESKRLDIEMQKAKNEEARIELEKQKAEIENQRQDIENNPEGETNTTVDDPKVEIVTSEEAIKKWADMTLREKLKFSWNLRKKLLLLAPKADESNVVRVSKTFGSSLIDPLGLLRPINPPDIKRVKDTKSIPGGVQKVITPPNLVYRWFSRRLGGLTVNGIFWSWYLTYLNGLNPFGILGYETNPSKYYFPRLYFTYIQNLKNTPLIGFALKGIEDYGKDQWGRFESEFKDITGKSIKEWEGYYAELIPSYTQNYFEDLSCDEILALRTSGDNPKLSNESMNKISKHCSDKYGKLLDQKFNLFKQNSVMAGDFTTWILENMVGLKLEMPKITEDAFKEVKGDSGDPVIEEQLDIELAKRAAPGGKCYEKWSDGSGETYDTNEVYVVEGGTGNY